MKMININRLECPEILITGKNPESKGEAETKKAIEHFRSEENQKSSKAYKKPKQNGEESTVSGFTVYKDRDVRKRLKEMFHGKCAYCESKILHICNGDIEHFRPKGSIKIGTNSTKPGYFWLASDWDNLLLSCPFCNQTNTHKIDTDGSVNDIALGKGDSFPLNEEDSRLKPTDGLIFLTDNEKYKQAFELEESQRLLLNPCKDENIEKYFIYDDSGAIISNVENLVTPLEKKRAQTSIEIYALHRYPLTIAREEKIIQIKAQIRRVVNTIEKYSNSFDSSDENRIWCEGIMREEMSILKKYKAQTEEYAGLARYIINKYFDEVYFK